MARCYIDDTELSENEIQFDEEGKLEPCTTCLNAIMDAAFCDGFEPGGAEVTEVPLLENVDENVPLDLADFSHFSESA